MLAAHRPPRGQGVQRPDPHPEEKAILAAAPELDLSPRPQRPQSTGARSGPVQGIGRDPSASRTNRPTGTSLATVHAGGGTGRGKPLDKVRRTRAQLGIAIHVPRCPPDQHRGRGCRNRSEAATRKARGKIHTRRFPI